MWAENPVRIYTVAELERLATDYLAKHFGADVLIPVDVDLLIEKAEGIMLDVWPKLHANHKVLGMVLRDVGSGELFIYIDEDLADSNTPNGLARYRMTVAEELAHVRLHRSLIEAIQSPDDFRRLQSHSQWTEIERNAKKLAAMLLMPTQPLMAEAREVYHQIAGQPQIREQLAKSISASKRWEPHIKKRLAIEMAKRFEVSEMAMHYRLGEWPAEVYKHIERALETGSDVLL
jgi:IrrE N-terminal-like domain